MHSEVAIFRTFHRQYVHRHFDKAFVILLFFIYFFLQSSAFSHTVVIYHFIHTHCALVCNCGCELIFNHHCIYISYLLLCGLICSQAVGLYHCHTCGCMFYLLNCGTV